MQNTVEKMIPQKHSLIKRKPLKEHFKGTFQRNLRSLPIIK